MKGWFDMGCFTVSIFWDFLIFLCIDKFLPESLINWAADDA